MLNIELFNTVLTQFFGFIGQGFGDLKPDYFLHSRWACSGYSSLTKYNFMVTI
jgi:hypothetical protein